MVPVWLPDLAALEWARADVFDMADAVSLTRTDLQGLAPAAYQDLSLQLVPATHMVDLAYDVLPVWRETCGQGNGLANNVNTDPDVLTRALRDKGNKRAPAQQVLVWRVANRVYHRGLGPSEAWLVQTLMEGDSPLSFGAFCAELGRQRGDEAAAALAFATLAQMLDDGVLRYAKNAEDMFSNQRHR